MAFLICVVLLLGAMALLINNVVQDRMSQQRVMQRLDGDKTGPGKLSLWMRAVGNSKFGQRSVSMDSETQTLLNRIGWRTASQRSLFAAFQVGTPIAFAGLVFLGYELFFPRSGNLLVVMLFSLALGYLIPKRLLAYAAKRRQQEVAIEVSTFIPLLRILFESGMAVEQALRVLSQEARHLLPVLTGELRVILARVDSGLELNQELSKTASLLDVDEFNDTCVILQQLIQQGGGAMKSLQALKELLDDRRLTRMEEYISKMSAKMSVVMMVFLFPALMIVLAGPSFVAISRAFLS
ncbi:type II secretion system protein F [Pseudomonas sp. FSL R10-0056]|mgnify:FL=1|uniref:Type II secretion system F family protein n=3 Tax=Pseudomonas TaxID=286 RepID=A0A267AXF5_PSEFR|nr:MULTISPECIES: type II secretion system F family protein [Pseudomonas]MBO4966655.1 type II secretion system F family protein [Pseudomonas sp.]MBP3858579.1 type II secretion system F family protein [Pseudomonas sp.]MBP3932965.1 type II secretion system F family protein [Pseudomonas sp.]MDA7023672.1 type II secretion system F family protein [Pseudomonas fragi]MDN5392288.1 type II secretion system F family protein [Pseudomonas sp.]